jgi:hypothetical protein
MQNFALTAADKQLVKTFLITFIAVVAGLPVAAAIMPGRQDALAETPATSVSKTAADLGLGSCTTGTGTGSAKTASTKSTHEVVETRTVSQNGNQNQVGTNNSINDHGATAQASDHSIAASVNALNDLVDVSDVLSHNNTTVSVPVNVPILSGSSANSGTGNGGLLGLGLLGL